MARTIDWSGDFHPITSCDPQTSGVDACRSRNRGSLRNRVGALSADTAVLGDDWLPISTRTVFHFCIPLGGWRPPVCVLQPFAVFAL